MYLIVVPLVSTDFADVAREIVENWVMKFGAPNVLHTDQGKSFGGKLIQKMCRLLGIDKIQTSPCESKGKGQTDRHNAKMADVILKFCEENPRNWATTLPYLNFFVQHDSKFENGSYAVLFGAWRGVPISS